MDQAEWVAAGLYDPAASNAPDRLALLEFLTSVGCDLQELVDAEARDRLFALAGDRIIRPSRPRYDATAAAAELSVDEGTIVRAWRSLGLPTLVEPVLGAQDLDALRTWLLVRDLLGEDTATALARVLGSAMARLAEAEASAMRAGLGETVDRARSGSEVVAARGFAQVAELVPRIGVLLDAVHRHHLEAARRHFELVAPTPDAVRCGIGFADLCGFTALSSALPMAGLSTLLSTFEQVASEVVQEGGGRVVKFLGDAVMFVAPDGASLADIAGALVSHPSAAAARLQLRAGLAYGHVLAQDGDYFGPPVNLAARLAAAAAPGEVLAAQEVVPMLGPRHAATPSEPRRLRGFSGHVLPYSVRPVPAQQD